MIDDDGQERVNIMPAPFVGSEDLENKHGGHLPLPVIQTQPGIYATVWIPSRDAYKLLRKRGGVLTLVIDTNTKGCPSISMMAQGANLVKEN